MTWAKPFGFLLIQLSWGPESHSHLPKTTQCRAERLDLCHIEKASSLPLPGALRQLRACFPAPQLCSCLEPPSFLISAIAGFILQSKECRWSLLNAMAFTPQFASIRGAQFLWEISRLSSHNQSKGLICLPSYSSQSSFQRTSFTGQIPFPLNMGGCFERSAWVSFHEEQPLAHLLPMLFPPSMNYVAIF